MATFLVNVLGIGPVAPGEVEPTGFSDIAGSPREGSIEAIVALGIAQGTSPTTYSPDDRVSRAQMATFLARTLDVVEVVLPAGGPDAFDDDDGNPPRRRHPGHRRGGHRRRHRRPCVLAVGDGEPGGMASFLVRVIDLGIELALFSPNVTSESYAALTGGDGAPGVGDPDGTGTAIVNTTDVPGVLCVGLEVAGIAAPTAARLHQGAPGSDGAVVAELPAPPAGAAITRCINDDIADEVLADPGAFYVTVVNAEFPNGALRGRLGELGAVVGGELTDVEVVPGPGDPDVLASYQGFTTSQPGVLCSSLLVLTTDDVTAAHVHEGAPYAEGSEVLDVRAVVIDPDSTDPAPLDLGLDCRRTSREAR